MAEEANVKLSEDSSKIYETFIKQVLGYNPHAEIKLIKKAFFFAYEAHKGQKRASGEEFFVHPLSVAEILMCLKADSATICAALLHDCVEDASVTIAQIKKEFGEEIASMVESLTKITGIKFETREEYTAENIRKILLATSKDIRVILIKLADRLHNMRTLKHFREEKQRRIAKETLEIYAPIAHKLGIRFIKGELEDLSLKVLEPEAYKQLRDKIAEKRGEREKKTYEFIKIIKEALKEKNIEADIFGRAKYFYSIYQKMKRQNKTFSEIYDLIAMRIITNSIQDCYAALGIIHELFKPIPRRFKDYIAVPKANGYQSLHTSVMGSHGKILEIQIRTKEMHHIAEEGIAAHWRYKGEGKDKRFDRKIAWLKHILEWKRESETAKDFIETLKIDLFQNEIVVFTPKGDAISLPENSSPIDFAYAVHTNIGHHCSKAEVNNKIVPLHYELKSGDIVNILTQKNIIPSRNWLSFVKTSKARSKIKSFLNIKSAYGERPEKTQKLLLERIEVIGEKKAPIKFSKCCSPQFGEDIVAFYTKDKKITVHKKDCPNIHTLDKKKKIEVKWIEEEEEHGLRVVVKDRVGLLADILTILTNKNINITSLHTRTRKDRITLSFKLKLPETTTMDNLVKDIRKVRDIIDVVER